MRTIWHTLRTAAWLGWQIESNWTDPFLFMVYSVVKPIASVLILILMYKVVAQADFNHPLFAYLYLGNAFYIYVGAVLTGISQVLVIDREEYGVLKYFYIAPIPPEAYLVGRGVARMATGTIAVAITLLFGLLVFRLPLQISGAGGLLFLIAMVLGMLAMIGLGVGLAGATLLAARHVWVIGEAVAGALYLFCGAVFPLEILPPFLRPLGYVLPLTYWLESIRRALLGPSAVRFPTFAGWSEAQLLLVLGGMTMLSLALGFGLYRLAERKARQQGAIDRETGY
ncbi:ABC transporter permease [Thermoflexus sp.]|uniref:ABC transporter permease n=1 Tax=Thermoflexus sp. TaxID=1969742 RepID=UPI0035E41C82